MSKSVEYYQRVVLHYLVGDVEHLLDQREARSGLILGPIASGIDTIGGIISGFLPNNSKDRSIKVMVDHMQYGQSLAAFVYKTVRCGLVHQGTAKYRTVFFAKYGKINRISPAYCGEEDVIYLDVIRLAEDFTAAARRIWEYNKASLIHLPSVGSADSLNLIKEGSLPPISSYLWDVAEAEAADEVDEINGRYVRSNLTSVGEIEPERYFNNAMEIPVPNAK